MARPTNKSDLLAAIKKERGNLDDYLDSLTPAQMTEPGIVGHWSVLVRPHTSGETSPPLKALRMTLVRGITASLHRVY